MNLEGDMQMRHDFLAVLIERLTKELNNDKTAVADVIAIGKILDAISDTIVKAHLMSEVTGVEEKTRNKMLDQMDRLDGRGGRNEP